MHVQDGVHIFIRLEHHIQNRNYHRDTDPVHQSIKEHGDNSAQNEPPVPEHESINLSQIGPGGLIFLLFSHSIHKYTTLKKRASRSWRKKWHALRDSNP